MQHVADGRNTCQQFHTGAVTARCRETRQAFGKRRKPGRVNAGVEIEMARAFIAADVLRELDPVETRQLFARYQSFGSGDPLCRLGQELAGHRRIAQLVAASSKNRAGRPSHAAAPACGNRARRAQHLGSRRRRQTSDARERVADDLRLQAALAVVRDVGESVAPAPPVRPRVPAIRRATRTSAVSACRMFFAARSTRARSVHPVCRPTRALPGHGGAPASGHRPPASLCRR